MKFTIPEEEILGKYKDAQQLYKVEGDDSEVVGQEIDLNNHLVYVVRKDGQMSLHHAENFPVEKTISKYPGMRKQ